MSKYRAFTDQRLYDSQTCRLGGGTWDGRATVPGRPAAFMSWLPPEFFRSSLLSICSMSMTVGTRLIVNITKFRNRKGRSTRLARISL
eukprot:6814426-Pyramimonas_sp.AAC.3